MKILAILSVPIVTLVSAASFASGFVCTGEGYNVKLYNEVRPDLGTKNPAVLVVSSAKGTIAKLQGSEIEKYNSPNAVAYQGRTNAYDTGRYITVRLEVIKQATGTGDFEGQHFARLRINADNGIWTAKLACAPYLKH